MYSRDCVVSEKLHFLTKNDLLSSTTYTYLYKCILNHIFFNRTSYSCPGGYNQQRDNGLCMCVQRHKSDGRWKNATEEKRADRWYRGSVVDTSEVLKCSGRTTNVDCDWCSGCYNDRDVASIYCFTRLVYGTLFCYKIFQKCQIVELIWALSFC